jgi:hypothetical protein
MPLTHTRMDARSSPIHTIPASLTYLFLQAAISTICRIQDQMGITDVSLLNFVVSDGATMIATRFVRPEGEAAATLYYAEGASFDRLQQHPTTQPQQQPQGTQATADGSTSSSVADEHVSSCGGCPAAVAAGGQEGGAVGTQELVGSSVLCEASYGISYSERGASVAFVASEPITGSTTDWVSPPRRFLSPSQTSFEQRYPCSSALCHVTALCTMQQRHPGSSCYKHWHAIYQQQLLL